MANHKNFTELFKNSTVETLTIEELAKWRLGDKGARLLLPPIQRSLVWKNEQIVNYWDSLLRRFPAGMMMVHQTIIDNDTNAYGRNAIGKTTIATENDWQLFDGQQRLSAILLGLGEGQLADSRKLWVDFDDPKPSRHSGLKYTLRISSIGQPFGYRADAPNQKYPLRERQERWGNWDKNNQKEDRHKAFFSIEGSDLIGAKKAIPLCEAYKTLRSCSRSDKKSIDTVVSSLATKLSIKEEKSIDRLHEFVEDFIDLLGSEIIIKKIEPPLITNPDNYVLLFKRLGQGGSPLSGDELTYSLLKQHYPRIHDQMIKIMRDGAGRFSSETHLVLGALRVAKVICPWKDAQEWEISRRPSPEFVSTLKEKPDVEAKFNELISINPTSNNIDQSLQDIRDALTASDNRRRGFPNMLLSRFPKELIDVLLLFSLKADDANNIETHADTLQAFVLFWLLFVYNDDKAARIIFNLAQQKDWQFDHAHVKKAISAFEQQGIANTIPRENELDKIEAGVKAENSSNERRTLLSWTERFAYADEGEGGRRPGEALRLLSTKRERIKRALMWAQSNYLSTQFKDYDPTSDLDEDLPVDLDHIIPHDLFGAHWTRQKKRLRLDNDKKAIDSFHYHRGIVGNSLGNFRWLAASDNRSRQTAPLEQGDQGRDFIIDDISEWNELIHKQEWGRKEITQFQQLIDLRTLQIYRMILTDGGISELLSTNPDEDYSIDEDSPT